MKTLAFLLLALHVASPSFVYADNMSSLLYSGNCITCHKDTKEESAPSMQEVRKRYKDAFSNKEDFVSYMSKWVANPDEKSSLMVDSIEKHGLMPELGFDEDMLRDITGYIYDTDFKTNGGRYWNK